MVKQEDLSAKTLNPPYLKDSQPLPVKDKQRARENQISRRDDTAQSLKVGIGDMDEAIMYYFKEVILPRVDVGEANFQVPIEYASPEKWKAVQKQGYLRDKNGKRQLPVILFKRDSLTKDRNVTSKVDANYPHNFYIQSIVKPNSRNYMDRFGIDTKRAPERAYIISVVPDYVKLEYSCVILTDLITQMNPIIEAINFASDSYWGPEDRFKFQSFVDSFRTEIVGDQNEDRTVRTTFTIRLNGYILPQTVNADPYLNLKRTGITKVVTTVQEIEEPIYRVNLNKI